ncbi:unnamed protein product [Trichobilharzia regenti]|nr:unnamed protein product [Trichobilharzia regenti]
MDNDRPQSSIPKRRVLKRGKSGETSDNDINPLMKKTVLYSQKRPDDSKDDFLVLENGFQTLKSAEVSCSPEMNIKKHTTD